MRFRVLRFPFHLFFASALSAQNFFGGFNFYLPPADTTSTRFLPAFPAHTITGQDFVAIDGQGHFAVRGQPIRFFGTNFVADGAFPTKSKAWFIAGRLRKMGFNVVRFHHMDNPWSQESLFEWGQDTRHLNPGTLDRLENLIAELKKNGVYVNMNLHVSRTFNSKDGVADADSIADYAKGVTFFDPQLLLLQKEYARQLLTHVNPYTGLPLVNDPVMAMVEVTNENSLYRAWRDGWLRPYSRGGKLIARHNARLDSLWNDFLRNKYGTTANLAAAWNAGAVDPGVTDQVRNGTFEDGAISFYWQLELHDVAKAVMSRESSGAHAGAYCAKIDEQTSSGTDWHIQWKQVGLSFSRDSVYTVQFAGRADSTRRIAVFVMRDTSPWTTYAVNGFELKPDWQVFTFSFRAVERVTGVGRLSFALGAQRGTYWFDDISFRSAAIRGLLDNENLTVGNIQRIEYSACASFTNQRVRDMSTFYLDLQNNYFVNMLAFLKQDLGVKVPIVGTNWNVGPADLSTQATADYLDNHSYWDHPSFPSQPWSTTDWLITNSPMVVQATEGGTIGYLVAAVPMANKPFTISEYNHAFPNRYQAEGVLFISSYAAFHDVDGVMFFDYNGAVDDWETDKVNGYFNINRNAVMMALMPSCAYAYRYGRLAKAKQTVLVSYAPDDLLLLPKTDPGLWYGPMFFDRTVALQHAVRTRSYTSATPFDAAQIPAPPQNPYVTDTGEIRWDTKGLLAVASPGFVGAAGFLQNFTGQNLGDLTLAGASDFATVTWLALDGDSLAHSRQSLLTVSSRVQNTGMVWDGTTTVHDRWGGAPTTVQPLVLTLRLHVFADSLRLYPLDARGEESGGFEVYGPVQPNFFEIHLDQNQTRTLWFGIEKFGEGLPTAVATGNTDVPRRFALLQNFPNPFNPSTIIRYALPAAGQVSLRIYNLLGRQMSTLVEADMDAGEYEARFEVNAGDVSTFASGVYFYRLQFTPQKPSPSTSQSKYVLTKKFVLLH